MSDVNLKPVASVSPATLGHYGRHRYQGNCSTEEGGLLGCFPRGLQSCKAYYSLSHDRGKAVGVGGKGILLGTKVFLENSPSGGTNGTI